MDITDPMVVRVVTKHALLIGAMAAAATVARDLFLIAFAPEPKK